MPAIGEQHRNVSNPFEEVKPRVSEYTAKEIATLQTRLGRQLGPEFLAARSGPSGQKVHYVPAEKVIALANEVFGFNGWSSSIQNIQVDFVDEHPQTLKISLGLHVVVRVTLRDGTFHEDIGYGHIENCKGKAAAFEKAKKEGTTDALKRALRNFGNVLGNCIYDKTYLSRVTKLKVEPTKFDEGDLHRHPDFAKKEINEKKAEPARDEFVKSELPATNSTSTTTLPNLPDSFDDLLGDFDEADFCVVGEDGHPDEVVLDDTTQTNIHTNGSHTVDTTSHGNTNRPPGQQQPMQPPSRAAVGSTSMGNSARQPQTPNPPQSRFGNQNMGPNQANQRLQQPQPGNQGKPQRHQGGSNSAAGQKTANDGAATHETPPPPAPTGNEPVAFFSARAVPLLPDDGSNPVAGQQTPSVPLPLPGQLFNPKADSPSIRKTPGIDHSSSRPVARNGQHVVPVSSSQQAGAPTAVGGGAAGAESGNSGWAPSRGVSGPSAAGPGGAATGHVQGRPAQPPQQQQQQQQQQQHAQIGRGNVVNPQMDHARRIGAPGGAGSPLSNRTQYKPPTMVKRPPLADVPNGATSATGAGGGGAGGGDLKRVKLG